MKTYPEYKESGVDWIGRIPSKWQLKKFKFIGDAIIGLTYSPDDVVDEGVIVLRSTNIQQGKITLNDTVKVNSKIPSKLTLKENDILICSRNGSRKLIGKNALIEGEAVGETFGAFTTVFRSKENQYISWVLNSNLFDYQAGMFLTTTVNQLTTGMLNNFETPFPPEEERAKIVKFLNLETSRIDNLIAEKERFITLLEEKRQALISHVVTKGLDDKVEMKDSGVEWIGKVPKHYIVSPVRYLVNGTSTGGTPKNQSSFSDEGTINWFAPGDFSGNYCLSKAKKLITEDSVSEGDAKLYPKDSILVVGIGATLGKVAFSKSKFSCNQQINILIPNKRVDCEFLTYALSAQMEQMKVLSNASTIGIMNQERTKAIVVTVPPLDEQLLIVEHIRKKNARLYELKQETQKSIELLKEHRTALISAAVTGKIDVREQV